MLLEPLNGDLISLASFAASYAVMAAIPGPNFMVVAEAGFSSCKSSALMAAAGVATGAMLLASIIATGAGPLYQIETIRIGATLAFCAFVFWLSSRAFTRATNRKTVAPHAHKLRPHRFFLLGAATALCNPASAAFFATSFLGAYAAAPTHLAPIAVFAVAGCWFASVGLVLTTGRMHDFHQRHAREIDLASGMALAGLGLIGLTRL